MNAVAHRLRRVAAALALSTVAALSICSTSATAADEVKFDLQKGDRIAILGNTLADRMQHDGWLETLLQARFPKHELVVRDLGFSGDEINLRLRSDGFGSPEDWLKRERATVVFAFFGYNESYAGDAGLEEFKKSLDGFVKKTLAARYDGKTPVKLVLFSPIAHEDTGDPNLPDGRENNARLKAYAAAMSAVAAANKAPFVDLFAATGSIYSSRKKTDKPLTINGVHLTSDGNRQLATEIDKILFGSPAAGHADAKAVERLRQAVVDKNFHWFNRYRTTDGYSQYGGRADLKFVAGQTNRVVAQRELEVLDVMTANRDKRIWAVAQGGDLKVDDSNAPDFISVVTNKPGPLPGGRHVILKAGDQAIEKMTVGKNLKVNLFASEEDFKDLVNPVQMAFDAKGRLWVAAWPTYPHWKPKDPMNDKLLILEDTDGDGKADKIKTFAGDLHNPTGFEFWNGGVLVGMAPDLLFLKDTDGDDVADVRVRVLSGIDSADTHHTSNSFTLDPGGALYFQEGTFHRSQIETPYKPSLRLADAGVFRYEPRTQKTDVYVSFGFANPHGHVFDRWGRDVVVDGTGANPFDGALFSGHVNFPQKHGRPPQVYQQRTRPCSGMEILSSTHFPPDYNGNLLVNNVIGFQGILRYKVEDKGGSFVGTELEPILFSSDPNFRPADVEMGPDGAIYFTDWHNPIIGHMQHNLRDPSRGKEWGRVYRVTYQGRELSKPAKIAGESIDKLLELLKHPEDRVRARTRIELSGRDGKEVLAALDRWTAKIDKNDPEGEHQALEALWVHQHFNAANRPLLDRVLASKDFRARAAAVRVLCYQRDQISDTLDVLKKMAADQHPKVRLEAVRAASFFPLAEAVEVPVIAAEHPLDEYVSFVRGETLKTLDPYWKKAMSEGRQVAFTTEAGARYLLGSMNAEQLLKMPRSRPVFIEMLHRPGLRDEARKEAVQGLAKLDKKAELRVVIDAIEALDEKQDGVDVSVVFDLVRLLTGRGADELKSARAELEKLAVKARQPVFRQIGFVSLINIDQTIDHAWTIAQQSPGALRDFVSAMPYLGDASLRATLYTKIAPLLDGLPSPLATKAKPSVMGRYVRVELPRRGTLTLAEIEVFSDGRNVARGGKASQKNVSSGGVASRAIDGNTNPVYGSGTQTHTEENTDRPWWEVDLGHEYPIDQIIVYNRGDGALFRRLDGFLLTVHDNDRRTAFRQGDNKATEAPTKFALGEADPAMQVRHAAMTALTYVRGQELKTFNSLARFVRDDKDRRAAIAALQRVPRNEWPKDQAQPLLETVRGYLAKLPTKDRTTPEALDAIEFAYALAALLPADEAKKVRADLGELGVRMVRVGTLFERMAYDKDVIVVKAGKPVEFLFENTDLMPHNFVITQPGAMEEIGRIAEETAQHPDAAARQYVPASAKILLGSRLLQPRDQQKLSWTAPSKPGVYPFVCTYPGHWRRMYGALYVVEDIDAYLENPDAYLAASKLEVKDELLKDRRPRTEWKFDDLAPLVAQMDHGRSHGNGKQLFTVANCVACHKLDGAGTQLGADLTKLDPQLKPLDILKDVVEPSSKINEKFQTWSITLDSGKTITGLLVEETKDQIKVIENPLTKAEPTVIKVSEIEDRKKSATSIMPKGLLDKLTREEILDLLAYVIARGDAKHKLFSGEGPNHGAHGEQGAAGHKH